MKSNEAFAGADDFISEGEAAVKAAGAEDETQHDHKESVSAATRLLKLATDNVRLFATPDDNAYASFREAGHSENWPIDSRQFTDWLGQRFYLKEGKVVAEQTLRDTRRTLAGLAKYQGEKHEVHLRVAPWEDGYLIDLCNDKWQVVFVGPGTVNVLDQSPVKFCRTSTMLPLPVPDDDAADVDLLFEFVNAEEQDHDLLLTWQADCLRPDSPHTVLEIIGQQGSGKSKKQEAIRSVVDPSSAPLSGKPKSVDDMFVAASKEHIYSMDNLSYLKADMQDELCRLATGGGRKQRALYTNADVHALSIKRPVIMNGIHVLATRPDLIDRVVQIEVPVITKYRKESQFLADLKKAQRPIFSELLQLFAEALDWVGDWDVPGNLRQQDFVELGQAISHVRHGNHNLFTKRYVEMRRDALLHALENEPVIQALMNFVYERGEYSGLQGKLLETLMERENVRAGAKDWPTPRSFKNRLKRATPALELAAIRIRFDPVRKSNGYHVTVEKTALQHTQRAQSTWEGTGQPAADVRSERCVRSRPENNAEGTQGDNNEDERIEEAI